MPIGVLPIILPSGFINRNLKLGTIIKNKSIKIFPVTATVGMGMPGAMGQVPINFDKYKGVSESAIKAS